MDINFRLNYYLGVGFENDKKWDITFDENDDTCVFFDNDSKKVIEDEMYCINSSFTDEKFLHLIDLKYLRLDKSLHQRITNYAFHDRIYINEMIHFFNSDNYFTDHNFIVRPGDVSYNTKCPIITKTRPVGNSSLNVLINLDKKRHWEGLQDVVEHDIPFVEKNNKLIWRGTATGYLFSETRPSRRTLVLKYWDHPNFMIDIGFCYDFEVIKGKGKLSIKDQLKSKFFISVEGGDVATGLKWMMYSNSCVLMPKPTMCSWFMEDKLTPYVHYVPLNDDFSDIEEKYNWCLNNLDKCEEIAKNSKAYVEQFLDDDRENLITNLVLRKYADFVRVNVVLANR